MLAFYSLARVSKKNFIFMILTWGLIVTPVYAEGPGETSASAISFDDINQALEDVLHTVNEIGQFALDFVGLIKEDPLNGLLELFNFIGQKLGLLDSGDGIAGAIPLPGPGLANQSYPEQDLFQPIGWVNHDNGLPGVHAGSKPFGTNLGMMIDGYFFTLFAPDSGQGPGGFLFYDVSDPYKPTLIRRVYEEDARTTALKEPHAFGLARINERRYMAFQSVIGVEFWDFTDLNNLHRVGEIDLPGVNGGDYSSVAWQLTWQAPYVYVASSEQGIFIVDASDPANPVLADRKGEANPVPVSDLGGFRVGPIYTFGNQLVISSMENRDGFASLDISDPVNPLILDRIPDLDQFYYASCFNGEHMAVSVRGPKARMVLYDLNDPNEFILIDDQLAVPGQLYCAFQDHYVFQGTEDRVHKIDISDPSNPVDVGSGTISGTLVRLVDHGQVSPLGNLVFIGNDHGTGSAFMPHSTEPDRSPPTVMITAPRNNAEGVAISSAIGISFSDILDFNTVTAETVRILDENGVKIHGLYSLQNGIVNFSPREPLQAYTTYQIVVPNNGVADVMGNKIQQAFTGSFSTGADQQYLDVDVDLADHTIQAGQLGDDVEFDIVLVDELPGVIYEWDFGDGINSGLLSSAVISHEYAEPGHYQVRLTIRWNGLVRQETFIKTIVPPLTESPAVQTSTLAQTDREVYVVNPDNNTVTAFDKVSRQTLWEAAVGNEPQTISWVDDELWVTVRGDDVIVRLNTSGDIVQSIGLPYGSAPFAIVFSEQRQTSLVSLSGSGKVVELDLNGNQLQAIDVVDPRAIAIAGDGGTAYVSRLVSLDDGAQVYELELVNSMKWTNTVTIEPDTATEDTQDRARGVTNYLFDLAISPGGNELVVAAKKDNIFRGEFKDGQALAHDKTIRAVAHQINLTTQASWEVDFDNRSNPRAVVYSPLGDYLFVAMQGSNKIAVIDVFSGSQRVEIETPLAPQGLMIDSVSGLLYVHNFMSRSISVFDVSGLLSSSDFSVNKLETLSTVSSELLNDSVLLGKQVFYNADDPRMSRESYISCASCHVDGGHDGRTWDFTERGEGLRNTITLEGRAGMGHGNVHWTANFDEIQDFENDIRNGFGGTGFLSDEDFSHTSNPLGNIKAGLSTELDALEAYVSSLIGVAKSPVKNADGSLSVSATAGLELFSALDCTSCHAGSNFVDEQRHVLPTLSEGSGLGMGQSLDQVGIETPTLLGLWNTAPYFHHGKAASLHDVLLQQGHGNAQGLSPEQADNLVDYLKSLDGRDTVVSRQIKGFQLQNERWGCLDFEGTDLVVNDCEDTESQWWLGEGGRIHLSEDPGQCIEHNGKAMYWSKVYLTECNESSKQQFTLLESGQVQLASSKWFALDAFGDRAGSKVGIWWRNKGLNQRWVLR
ncbi:hypothetical protein A9Q81_11595 [Gammaproteobacteria bacterium 42_54_T18]|nr:hypothetical protein A9Q81_11595 [Gammaproteobacteria bacterium 42_54_T18]